MKSEFLIAITQLAAERNLPRDIVLNAVEAALISAFKKDRLADCDLAVRISSATGEVHVYARRTVVADEAFENDKIHLKLADARKLKPDIELGGILEEEVTPANAGRIAAQTAKQVVMQRLREAERDIVFTEYSGKENALLSAVVQRFEGRNVIVDLGRAEALLPASEQVQSERYRPGQRIKVLVLEVGKTTKGPQILVSRTHKDVLRRLFELEVPEILNGAVAIKAIAREPGFRSKIAVTALQDRVDPVGSCVGLRGIRIQNIVNEMHGEKIDVLEWSEAPHTFIARALGPAQVMHVVIKPEEKTAIVIVPDRQLSLAIGREGQNARLAAKLTGWRIDIKSTTEAEAQKIDLTPPPAEIAERLAAAARLAAPARRGAAPATPAPSPAPVAQDAASTVAEPPSLTDAEEPAPAAAEVEAPSLAEALAKEETWKVVPQTQRGGIRFAEDILDRRGGGRRKGGRDDRESATPKKAKRGGGSSKQFSVEPEE
ncbi:MAG: transcription termination/antitermination protein NusA [Dehalococcoidia bacterium]|nr:transcription termination/antitermination protein NusA [Dehalococcoidia bacterium]